MVLLQPQPRDVVSHDLSSTLPSLSFALSGRFFFQSLGSGLLNGYN